MQKRVFCLQMFVFLEEVIWTVFIIWEIRFHIYSWQIGRCIKQWRYLLNRWIIQEEKETTITQKIRLYLPEQDWKDELISDRAINKNYLKKPSKNEWWLGSSTLMINGRQRKLTLHYHQVLSLLWLLLRRKQGA